MFTDFARSLWPTRSRPPLLSEWTEPCNHELVLPASVRTCSSEIWSGRGALRTLTGRGYGALDSLGGTKGEHGEQAGSRLQAGRWGRPRDGRAECMSPPISPPPPYPPGACEAGMRQRRRDRWGGSGGAGTNGPAPPVYVCNGSGRATAMNPDRGPIGRWVWGGRLAEDPHPSK